MNGTQLTYVLLAGIIIIKLYWIYTEISFSRNRINFTMLKTNAVEAGILLLQLWSSMYYPFPNSFLTTFVNVLGVAMYVTGFLLAVWARIVMNKSWGVPGEHIQKQDKLVTTGPFAITRNPIYLGFLLLYFGFAFAIDSWLFFLRVPLLIYFYKSAKAEEKLLEKKFGEKYLKYKSSVPLFF